MERPVIDTLEVEIEGARYLRLSAIRGGAVVGTVDVFWLNVEGKAPELCNLFVPETARRQGIAAQLIRAARKCMGVAMCLHTVRESPGYWLYRKLGFLEIGMVKEKEHSVWMLIHPY